MHTLNTMSILPEKINALVFKHLQATFSGGMHCCVAKWEDTILHGNFVSVRSPRPLVALFFRQQPGGQRSSC